MQRLAGGLARAAGSIAQLMAGEAAGAVTVRGWVRSVRVQKHVAFVAVSDGSQLAPLQVLCSPEQAAALQTGAAIECKGEKYGILF